MRHVKRPNTVPEKIPDHQRMNKLTPLNSPYTRPRSAGFRFSTEKKRSSFEIKVNRLSRSTNSKNRVSKTLNEMKLISSGDKGSLSEPSSPLFRDTFLTALPPSPSPQTLSSRSESTISLNHEEIDVKSTHSEEQNDVTFVPNSDIEDESSNSDDEFVNNSDDSLSENMEKDEVKVEEIFTKEELKELNPSLIEKLKDERALDLELMLPERVRQAIESQDVVNESIEEENKIPKIDLSNIEHALNLYNQRKQDMEKELNEYLEQIKSARDEEGNPLIHFPEAYEEFEKLEIEDKMKQNDTEKQSLNGINLNRLLQGIDDNTPLDEAIRKLNEVDELIANKLKDVAVVTHDVQEEYMKMDAIIEEFEKKLGREIKHKLPKMENLEKARKKQKEKMTSSQNRQSYSLPNTHRDKPLKSIKKKGNSKPIIKPKMSLEEALKDDDIVLQILNEPEKKLESTIGEGFVPSQEDIDKLNEIDSKLQEFIPEEEWETKSIASAPLTHYDFIPKNSYITATGKIDYLREQRETREEREREKQIDKSLKNIYRPLEPLPEEEMQKLLDKLKKENQEPIQLSDETIQNLLLWKQPEL